MSKLQNDLLNISIQLAVDRTNQLHMVVVKIKWTKLFLDEQSTPYLFIYLL